MHKLVFKVSNGGVIHTGDQSPFLKAVKMFLFSGTVLMFSYETMLGYLIHDKLE